MKRRLKLAFGIVLMVMVSILAVALASIKPDLSVIYTDNLKEKP